RLHAGGHPLRGDAPDAPAAADRARRAHRARAVVRRPVLDHGPAQSRPAEPHRLDLVHRLADRVRSRGRAGGGAAVPPAHVRERRLRAARGRRGARDPPTARERRSTAMTSRGWMVTASLVLLSCGACAAAPGRPGKDSEALAPGEVVEFRALY